MLDVLHRYSLQFDIPKERGIAGWFELKAKRSILTISIVAGLSGCCGNSSSIFFLRNLPLENISRSVIQSARCRPTHACQINRQQRSGSYVNTFRRVVSFLNAFVALETSLSLSYISNFPLALTKACPFAIRPILSSLLRSATHLPRVPHLTTPIRSMHALSL